MTCVKCLNKDAVGKCRIILEAKTKRNLKIIISHDLKMRYITTLKWRILVKRTQSLNLVMNFKIG